MTILSEKIALVTGASRGIGKAIALSLAKSGANVIGTATSESGAANITAYFKDAGLTGVGKMLNVTDPESIKALFNDIDGTVEVLVNNAAITADNLFIRMKDDEWDSVINTNLNAVFSICKAAIKGMMKNRWGRIINISSIVATSGNPGQPNYCAAKAGVIGFSKSLAQEIASRNITVNVVSPGFIDTDMTRSLTDVQQEHIMAGIPMKRVGQPEEIAACVNFLASPEAGYITGQTLHVNGGMLMV